MEKRFPLVSICIPVYNGATYLTEALLSAEKQTYRPLEIIITDDASTDNSIELAREFSLRSGIPVGIYHHQPSGIGANWNYSVEKAKGEYIKFLFQDDVLYPECVSRLMELALLENEIGFVFSDRDFFLDNNIANIKGVEEWTKKYSLLYKNWSFPIKKVQEGVVLLKDPLLISPPFNKVGEPTCVLLRKSVLIKAGLFNTSLKQALDYEAWYRIFKYCKVAFTSERLCAFRIHINQETRVNQRRKLKERLQYRKEVWRHLYSYLDPSLKKKLHEEFGFSIKRFYKKGRGILKKVFQ